MAPWSRRWLAPLLGFASAMVLVGGEANAGGVTRFKTLPMMFCARIPTHKQSIYLKLNVTSSGVADISAKVNGFIMSCPAATFSLHDDGRVVFDLETSSGSDTCLQSEILGFSEDLSNIDIRYLPDADTIVIVAKNVGTQKLTTERCSRDDMDFQALVVPSDSSLFGSEDDMDDMGSMDDLDVGAAFERRRLSQGDERRHEVRADAPVMI
eukprot:TRINITY_DN38910_c0_g1_i1.p1 TRINITY_DN38910_c0_g1~~TRINITY_DN38910_c0_g1_i1.p1  ORF type:complete len:229 (-),score=45.49 TRINITY_DN38910_c0_g1_i1:162-791(-)